MSNEQPMGDGGKVRGLAVPAPRVPAIDLKGDKRPTKRPWEPPKVHTMDIWGTKGGNQPSLVTSEAKEYLQTQMS